VFTTVHLNHQSFESRQLMERLHKSHKSVCKLRYQSTVRSYVTSLRWKGIEQKRRLAEKNGNKKKRPLGKSPYLPTGAPLLTPRGKVVWHGAAEDNPYHSTRRASPGSNAFRTGFKRKLHFPVWLFGYKVTDLVAKAVSTAVHCLYGSFITY
jgi:hypothetical protein